ncbi:MAG: hypothetical protein KAH56_05130 [Candidatus Krumholzibacteria bacterium]|nr:hypothetical protein [Candidatus Krumholzibacteria bacterium]
MTPGLWRDAHVRPGGAGLLLIFLLLAIPVLAEVEPTPLIDFRIKDQFGKLHTSGSYRNSVAIVVSGDRKGNEYTKEWSPVLADSLAAEVRRFRVRFISHAHLKGAPFFMKGTIKGKLSNAPDDWVLMDWSGEFNQAYEFKEDHCNIVVFDQDGLRRIQVAVQQFDQKIFTRLLTGIRRLDR